MRQVILSALLAGVFAAPAFGKLPPLSDDAKAKVAVAALKSDWSNKVGAYQLCKAMDKVAEKYRSSTSTTSRAAPAPTAVVVASSASAVIVATVTPLTSPASVATPPCADPGPYVADAAPAKPIEAAGAHSPPETVKGPPSTTATSSQLDGKK